VENINFLSKNFISKKRNPILAQYQKLTKLLILVLASYCMAVATIHAEPKRNNSISMHGATKYNDNFQNFSYVNPNAPKGGKIRLHAIGTFDSLNPYIIKGKSAVGLHHGSGFYFETLARRSRDESFSLYGLLAETIKMPEDRSWIEFTLRPEAKFSDQTPVTVEDVKFSWRILKHEGKPNARATWARVKSVLITNPRKIRFIFEDDTDRELPLLIAGFLPILSKNWWENRDFSKTTLEVPPSSGPYIIKKIIPGRSIIYKYNPKYWGRNLAVTRGQFNIQEITYKYYRDDAIALEAFKAGDYDFRYESNASRWATQYDSPAITNGNIIREITSNGIPSGMKALVFNLRKPPFNRLNVRKALTLAFNFEWLNKNLLHNGYVRTNSIFSNSSLIPSGPPTIEELKLLNPWRGKVPEEVFGHPFKLSESDGTAQNRSKLRKATMLLKKEGFYVHNGTLHSQDSRPFRFVITIRNPSNERIALTYSRNLKRLGIDARVRLIDTAQFQTLIDSYDFDMVFGFWGVTLSPGNEQENYWGSKTSNQPGGRNWPGISDPAIDEIIHSLVSSKTHKSLVAAARALDRVFMWNYYVLPLYHLSGQRIAYWKKVSKPKKEPVYGLGPETFWITNNH